MTAPSSRTGATDRPCTCPEDEAGRAATYTCGRDREPHAVGCPRWGTHLGATDREVEAATAALRAAAIDPDEIIDVAVWQGARVHRVEGHPAELAAIALKAARAAAAPTSEQRGPALQEQLLSLLDQYECPINGAQWVQTGRIRALLAKQPGGGQ